jgi:archaellum component FlaF (FlaF/FlaG flagellin family)
MRIHAHRRLGLGTIMTAMIMLSVTAVLGTAALIFTNNNFTLFKTALDQTFTNTAAISKNQESLVIENSVYHSSTQQLNFTLTNTGSLPINVTKIEIDSPSWNLTSVLSNSITNAESLSMAPTYLKPLSSKNFTETIYSPSSTILPGQTFTTGALYPCFTDPVTISATTARNTVIKTQVAPNVGWYDSHWQFRKRITLNYTQIVGNPNPIQLDNVQNTTGSGTSSYTLPNFVVGTGSNRLLLVNIQANTGTVQTLTYAGIPLTKANGTTNTVDSEIWYLTNPPIGTANIAVTMTATANVVIGAYSFFGADQTFPISFSATNIGSAVTSGSVTAYTTNPNSWVVDSISVQNRPSSFTQNSGQTRGWNMGTSTVTGGSSYVLTLTPPTAQAMSWSWSGNQNYAAVAVEIKSSAFYNFPLLVNETKDTDLKNYAKSNRYDLLFTACDGKTKLDHEIENFTTTTGSLVAWVQVPNIYYTPNNVIYMYYNNTAATNQQNIASTWDPTFSGVWHFANNPGTGGTPPSLELMQYNFTNGTTNSPILQSYQNLNGFTVGSHTDRLLLVTVSADNPSKFNSITYGGQALTQLQAHVLGNVDTEFWYLLNPPTGTANLHGTLTSANGYISMVAYSIYGVDQTTPIAPVAPAVSGTSQTVSISLTNIWPNSLLMDQAAVGYGAQCGSGCGFNHAPWDLENPNNFETWLTHPIDINHDTVASSVAFPSTTCASTTFQWHVHTSAMDTWVDAAVEIKSDTSLGDTTVLDSTSNNNFFSPINLPSCGQVLGKIGGAASLNGVNQFFVQNTTLTGMPPINGPQTVSAWYLAPSQVTFPQDISSLQYDPACCATSTALRMGFQTSTSIDAWKYSPATTIVTKTPIPLASSWHNVVYTYNRTTSVLYVDGVRQASSSTAPLSGTPNSLYVGASTSTKSATTLAQFLKGTIDELRYSKTVRSASWIATDYNNQAFPSTFIKIGPPEKVTDIRRSQ